MNVSCCFLTEHNAKYPQLKQCVFFTSLVILLWHFKQPWWIGWIKCGNIRLLPRVKWIRETFWKCSISLFLPDCRIYAVAHLCGLLHNFTNILMDPHHRLTEPFWWNLGTLLNFFKNHFPLSLSGEMYGFLPLRQSINLHVLTEFFLPLLCYFCRQGGGTVFSWFATSKLPLRDEPLPSILFKYYSFSNHKGCFYIF